MNHGNLRELIGNGPPLFSVQSFRKHGSVGVCRRFAIHPARILCVAGYFRCIGDSFPVQVFPATFPVAFAAVFTFSIYYPSFQLDISERRLSRRVAVARFHRAATGRNTERPRKRRSPSDGRDRMLVAVFNPIPFHTSGSWEFMKIPAMQE